MLVALGSCRGVLWDMSCVVETRLDKHQLAEAGHVSHAVPRCAMLCCVQMEVPQARNGWSGGLVNLIPSTTGTSLFTAKTGKGLFPLGSLLGL